MCRKVLFKVVLEIHVSDYNCSPCVEFSVIFVTKAFFKENALFAHLLLNTHAKKSNCKRKTHFGTSCGGSSLTENPLDILPFIMKSLNQSH